MYVLALFLMSSQTSRIYIISETKQNMQKCTLPYLAITAWSGRNPGKELKNPECQNLAYSPKTVVEV